MRGLFELRGRTGRERMKQQVIAMRRHTGKIAVSGRETQLILPPGCTGILFCFESKKAAREYWGKDVELVQIEEVEKNK